MPLWYIKQFNEAEVDGQPVGNEEIPEDYTADAEGNPPPENQPAEPGPQGEELPPENGEPQGEEPVDYTTMGEDPYGGEQPPANGGGAQPQQDPESVVDDLKRQEEELYNELTPEQLDIKHKELKTLYLNMYDVIISIIDRVGDINVAEENMGTVEYVSNTLSSLKDMLSDYVNDVYKTKSYIENSINYNRFLAILNGISKILEEMNSKNDKK